MPCFGDEQTKTKSENYSTYTQVQVTFYDMSNNDWQLWKYEMVEIRPATDTHLIVWIFREEIFSQIQKLRDHNYKQIVK